MTNDERQQLRALADAATPGPWVWDEGDGYAHDMTGSAPVVCRCGWEGDMGNHEGQPIIVTDMGVYGPCVHDRAFIAAARMGLPKLLDAVEEKDREIARLRDLVEGAFFEALSYHDRLVPTELQQRWWEGSVVRKTLGDP